MLLLPLVAGIAFALPGQQEQSIYRQIVTQPDVRNGYEDYLKAADIVNSELFDALAVWHPDTYERMAQAKRARIGAGSDSGVPRWSEMSERQLALAKQLDDNDVLSAKRLMVERFGTALNLVRNGNGKQVWDPREKIGSSTVFPEFARFKALARLYDADAYVKFADGNSRGATQDLLDGLIFSARSAGTTLIGELVSSATRAIILASFEQHLARLSDEDAKQIIKTTDAMIAEKPSIVTAWTGERDLMLASLDAMFERSTMQDFLTGSDDDARILEVIATMTPAEKQAAKSQLRQQIQRVYSGLIDQFNGPEATWADPVEVALPEKPAGINSTQDLVDTMVHQFVPIFGQANSAFMMRRTQLRLLNLHARIIDFRWQHDRLPNDLAEAIPRSLIFDPLGKEDFHYELRENVYRLYSRGNKSIGALELKYKRSPGSEPGDQNVPPPVLLKGKG